jgi:protein ImuB
MPTSLYLCLHVPDFVLQAALRHHPEYGRMPLAILDGLPPREEVVAVNTPAKERGLHLGMSRLEASCFGDIFFVERALHEEHSTKSELLRFAFQFSPLVEDYSRTGACTLVLDIGGSLALFGDTEVIVRELLGSVSSIHIYGNTVTSFNFHAAVCMARSLKCGSSVFIPKGMERHTLDGLPIQYLLLMGDQQDTLATWGIHSFGELASIPLKQLVTRLGPYGETLSRMSRGEYEHFFSPIELPAELSEATSFDTPLALIDSLMFSLSSLLMSLAGRAAEHFVSIAAVSLCFGLDSSRQTTRTTRTVSPTNDTKVWLKLIHLDLLAHPLDDAVVSISIKAETGVVSKIQLGLFSPQLPEVNRLAVTLARIHSIVGDGNAGTPMLINSHATDAFILTSFRISSHECSPTERPFVRLTLRRARPASRIEPRIKNSALHSFVCGAIRYIVTAGYGPWNSDSGWWGESEHRRLDWDIVARRADTGALLCCCISYIQVDRSWYLEGTYD